MPIVHTTTPNKAPPSQIRSCALAVQLAISQLKSKHYGAAALALSLSTGVVAQQAIDISAQPLSSALKTLGQQTGLQIAYDAKLIEGKQSPAVKGAFKLDEVLKQLLKGTDIRFNIVGNSATLVASNSSNSVMMLDPVRIQGSEEARFGDAPTEPGRFKAEYQTTATRMALSLRETPQAISVVTRESMDARQVKGIYNAIELTTGVGLEGGFTAPGPFAGRGYYAQNYSLRGQGLNYYTGVKSDGFATGSLSAIDLAAYERVEVVKGPSGFYGQGSLGGFINLVRKKPQEEFDANISAQIGSYNTYRTEADITGAITDDKNLRGQLSFAYENADSFTDDISTETLLFAPSLELLVGDSTRALLQLLYQEEKFDVNNGVPVKQEGNQINTYNIPRSFQFGAIGSEKSSTDMIEARLKLDHEVSSQWLASLLLQGNKTERDIIQANSGYDYFGDPTYVFIAALKDNTESDSWAGELRLEGDFNAFGREHQLLVGAERNQINITRNNSAISPTTLLGGTNLYADNFSDFGLLKKNEIPIDNAVNQKIDIENSAIYGVVILSLLDRTQLLVSSRYDWSKNSSGSDTNDTVKVSNKDFTFRIGITQELTDNISAYVTYAESFKPVFDTDSSGSILDPETGEGYELGMKADWLDNKLGATLAVYRQELDNRPIIDPASRFENDGTFETYFMSAGLHRTDGVELEITGSPLPGLTVALSVNWMDNEFIDDDDDNVGLSIAGSVDRQYSLYANYELQGGPLKGFGFGATLVGVGDRKYIDDNEQVYLEGYERVDLGLSYNGLSNWDISLQMRNVLDKKYIERTSNSRGNYNFYGSPSAALLQAKYHF